MRIQHDASAEEPIRQSPSINAGQYEQGLHHDQGGDRSQCPLRGEHSLQSEDSPESDDNSFVGPLSGQHREACRRAAVAHADHCQPSGDLADGSTAPDADWNAYHDGG